MSNDSQISGDDVEKREEIIVPISSEKCRVRAVLCFIFMFICMFVLLVLLSK
jgi:hypothetical protein